jgi:hypothetical protein
MRELMTGKRANRTSAYQMSGNLTYQELAYSCKGLSLVTRRFPNYTDK